MEGVLYEDVNDPRGIGLLTWSDNPDFFVEKLRPFLRRSALHGLAFKPALHNDGPHVLDRLRAEPGRLAARPSAQSGDGLRMEVARLVSAAAQGRVQLACRRTNR